MRRRETTKTMNKHQSPKRSEGLSREKDKQRITLIQKSQKRRHLLSGAFFATDDSGSQSGHLCSVGSYEIIAGLKHPLLIESEGRKKDE
jgi:hypothetical protein